MIRRKLNGIVFYQFVSLSQHAEVLHAVFTRLGGKSGGHFCSLNVGHTVGDEPTAVQANHDLIFKALGLKAEQVVTARQVHNTHIAVVDVTQRGTIVPATDGLISQERGIALLLRFADCLPLLLYDPVRHAIGLVHVGWRGLLSGIVPHALAMLKHAFGCNLDNLFAGLGPAIGPCCYKVGPEFARRVERTFGTRSGLLSRSTNGTLYFDLPRAVRWQLQENGVHWIEDSQLCTSCHTDEFFSHRAERGHTGRFAVIMALRESKFTSDLNLNLK